MNLTIDENVKSVIEAQAKERGESVSSIVERLLKLWLKSTDVECPSCGSGFRSVFWTTEKGECPLCGYVDPPS